MLNPFRVVSPTTIPEAAAELDRLGDAAQIYAGIRGLEAVYRATWPFIRDYQDRAEPAKFPAGWAPDTAAFKAGLDESTTEFTDKDRAALNDWYMRNGGEIPKWVTFMTKHRPEFLKAHRLRWEGVFRGALVQQHEDETDEGEDNHNGEP